MTEFRTTALRITFDLLYGPFVLFHEFVGRFIFGRAWDARRRRCLKFLNSGSLAIEVGAGEGRLVAESRRRIGQLRGFEPAQEMRALGWAQHVPLTAGSSSGLPVASASIDQIVVTYPGSWIYSVETWNEFDRVLAATGLVSILLGGTYKCGPWSTIRKIIIDLAYGRKDETSTIAMSDHPGFIFTSSMTLDKWGRVYLIQARRAKLKA